MGLDIYAYSNISINDSDSDNDGLHIYSSVFKQENMKSFEGVALDYGEEFTFRAGSYSSYNRARAELCQLINGVEPEDFWEIEENESKPFYWLINFSACGGYIGTSYCEILKNDFDKHWSTIQDKGSEYLKVVMADFKQAFELAANNGLVQFC